jgi:hypothetical protein
LTLHPLPLPSSHPDPFPRVPAAAILGCTPVPFRFISSKGALFLSSYAHKLTPEDGNNLKMHDKIKPKQKYFENVLQNQNKSRIFAVQTR